MLSSAHLSWGFDKMMNKIKAQGHIWNHKRVYRVYCEMRLNLRTKPKKRLPTREALSLVQPIHPNECWSIDFMSDALSNGRRFRTLNVMDDYNREALLIKPSISLPASYVTRLLDQLAGIRGYPRRVRVDNGPEFISQTFKSWAAQHQIDTQYIQPGKPAQNGFIERFNRTYREDVLGLYLFESLDEVTVITKRWMDDYNNARPHEAIGNLAPRDFARDREQDMTFAFT